VSDEVTDLGNEAVAMAGNRSNIAAVLRVLAEGLADHGDIYWKVNFFDEGVRPNLFQQFVFGEDVPVIAHQAK
jgi:hypothetical protein